MILARIFSKIYSKNGIILIDTKGQKYICGNPRKDNPITLKLLKKNLPLKLVLDPEIEFPEAYMRNEIIIENASSKRFFNGPSKKSWKKRNKFNKLFIKKNISIMELRFKF